MNVKPMYQDFDITKNGHVSKMQFVRVLAQLGINAPDHLMHLVLKRYMDKGNVDEVNYVDFCNDIDTPEDMFGVGRDYNQSTHFFARTQAQKVGSQIVSHQPDDIDDVLARIRTFCKQQRVRVAEFFRDFDKLRSGHITDSQFRIGLSMAKIVLSTSEFDLLLETFKSPKEGKHLRWKDFCDAVEEVFTTKGLEKKIDANVGDVRVQTIYGKTKPNKGERNVSEDVVYRFKQLLVRNRLDAKSFFQDFDRHKHFKVSPKQFRQVLANFGFLMSDDDLHSLVKTYGNAQNDIEYLRFIDDANPTKGVIPSSENLPTSSKSSYTDSTQLFKGEDNFEKLMTKVKNQIKKDRIRLGEFFQDHDLLRKGVLAA
jgi:Ca2+-binding EF-hand superfamily protein